MLETGHGIHVYTYVWTTIAGHFRSVYNVCLCYLNKDNNYTITYRSLYL